MIIGLLILLGVIIIGSLIGCIICSVKSGGTVCEGIKACCQIWGASVNVLKHAVNSYSYLNFI